MVQKRSLDRTARILESQKGNSNVRTKVLLLFTAALSLATSSLAGATINTTRSKQSNETALAANQQAAVLQARGEPQPGDKRGNDDGTGHKANPLQVRGEPQPGDKRGNDDGTGHKANPLQARGEPQPGDKRGNDDGTGHKVNPLMARGEPEPGDQRRGRGNDDGKGHKVVSTFPV
jgi:hypothetical protein